jgi:hypothetical protein
MALHVVTDRAGKGRVAVVSDTQAHYLPIADTA